MGQPQEIVVYPSKRKMLTYALACGGGVLIFGAAAAYAEELDIPLFGQVIAILLAGLSGLLFVYSFHKLVRRNPALIVGREGIRDNPSPFSGGLLLWEEIADVFAYEVQGQRFLGIVPKNPEAFLSRQGWIKTLVIKMNMRRNGCPVGIAESILPVTVDELLSQIENFPEFRRQNGVSPRQE